MDCLNDKLEFPMSKKEQIAATNNDVLWLGVLHSAHRTTLLGAFGPASPVRVKKTR